MMKKASKGVEGDSDTLFEWIDIGAQFVATNSALSRLLNSQHMLRRNTTTFDPITHRALRLESELLGERHLAAQDFGCSNDGVLSGTRNCLPHMEQDNADFVSSANANCGKPTPDTSGMGKQESSPFWKRLGSVWPKGEVFSGPGVAAYLGMVGNGTTGRWQRGDALPRPEHLIKLSDHCKVSIDWLLLGRGPKQLVRWDEETAEMLSLWSGLNENNRHHVRTAAKFALASQRQAHSEMTEA